MNFVLIFIDDSLHKLLLPHQPCKCLLIDGWHRYAKALRMRLTEIPAVVLTEDETKQIRK